MAQVAVIGLGRFGFHVARHLHLAGHDVLAIDIDPGKIERLGGHVARAAALDARDKAGLEALGLRDLDMAVVSLGERIDLSALVSLHLKDAGVRRIVAKVESEDQARLLELIGVHEIVYPERETAERLARRMGSANLLDYVPLGEDFSVQEMAPPEPFIGRTLEELKLRNRFGIQVLGIRDVLTEEVHVNPAAGFCIKESDALLVLGRNEDLDRLKKL